MTDARTPTADGTLDRYPFPRLLYYLYKKAFVGELEVSSPGTGPMKAFFREGLPVRCEMATADDVLGRVLLERGMIDQEAFHRSLEAISKGDQLQGQFLLSIGALDQKQLIDGLCLQLRRKLYRFFSLVEGTFGLYSGEHPHGVEGDAAYVRIDPLWVIYQGVRNTFDAGRLTSELQRLEKMAISLRPEFQQVRERYGLADEDQAMVEMLARGKLTFRRVFEISNLGPLQTQMLLYTFWVTEVLVAREATAADENVRPARAPRTGPVSGEVVQQIGPLTGRFAVPDEARRSPTSTAHPAAGVTTTAAVPAQPTARAPSNKPAATQGVGEPRDNKTGRTKVDAAEIKKAVVAAYGETRDKNHFEVLGLERGATTKQVRDAYFQLAKKYHPDRCSGLGKEIMEKAEEVFRLLNEANSVLTDKDARQKYEDQLDGKADEDAAARAILEAEVAFQKGTVLMRKRAWKEAADAFQQAVELAPKEGEHISYLAYARYNDPAVDNALELPKIKQQMLEAVNYSPKSAACHFHLGEVYLALDDIGRAKTCFNKVLEIKPRHIDAQRHIRLINMRKEKGGGGKKGGGFFSRKKK